MILENYTPPVVYPLFYLCKNAAEFNRLNTQASRFLNYPNEGAENYCRPIMDKAGKHWFTVSQEILPILTEALIAECVSYNNIIIH